jgi:hypothetical protein
MSDNATGAVDLDRLGDEIAELSGHLDAATARLLALIREFDVRGGGTAASAPARSGSPGASVWSRARRASGSASPGRWARSRDSPTPSRAGSSPIPRSGP